jgi:hypothetical protein
MLGKKMVPSVKGDQDAVKQDLESFKGEPDAVEASVKGDPYDAKQDRSSCHR